MFDDSARAFFKQPLIARLATITPKGLPHNVPVWFMTDGDDIIFISERNTGKVRNVFANPNGAVVIGGDTGQPGYMLQGTLTVEEDPDFAWMKRMTRHYEPPEQAERDIEAWSKTDMIIIRMTVSRVVKVA